MPTASTTYTDDHDEYTAEYEIAVTLSAYDPGQTYGPPELCYPPEGGEFEGIEFVDLVKYMGADGTVMDLGTIGWEARKSLEVAFRLRMDTDDDFRDKIVTKIIEEWEPDYQED